jgi:hypothetical protein
MHQPKNRNFANASNRFNQMSKIFSTIFSSVFDAQPISTIG